MGDNMSDESQQEASLGTFNDLLVEASDVLHELEAKGIGLPKTTDKLWTQITNYLTTTEG